MYIPRDDPQAHAKNAPREDISPGPGAPDESSSRVAAFPRSRRSPVVPGAASGALHLDLARLVRRSLRKSDGQDPRLHRSRHLVGLDTRRDDDLSPELPSPARLQDESVSLE